MFFKIAISKDGGKQPLQRSTFYLRPGQDGRPGREGAQLMFKFTQHMVHQQGAREGMMRVLDRFMLQWENGFGK